MTTHNSDTMTATGTDTVRRLRRQLLVHRAVRDLVLATAAEKRRLASGAARFTRVSRAWLDRMEAKVWLMIESEVQAQPSKGRTIR